MAACLMTGSLHASGFTEAGVWGIRLSEAPPVTTTGSQVTFM